LFRLTVSDLYPELLLNPHDQFNGVEAHGYLGAEYSPALG
jgi:hypothetical protein